MKSNKLSKKELNFVLILGLALGVRQLSMSLIVPFVASFTQSLLYGTLALGGIALGIFSLTQGIFQIPFGSLADKIGNKKVVLTGLGILILGLLLACISNNAYIYVLSRALQGSGAITAAGYSWVSQKVSKDKLSDSIGIIGTFIGLSAGLSLGIGPLLIKFFTVKDLYIFSTIFVSIVFLLVLFFLHDDKESTLTKSNTKNFKKTDGNSYIKNLFKSKTFIGFSLLAFCAPFIGLAGFFVIPEYLDKTLGNSDLWIILTPSVLLSIIFMRIAMKFVKKGFTKQVTLISATCLLLGSFLLLFKYSVPFIFVQALLIFTGYTILSTLIPTLINQIAKDEFRGSLNGIINGIVYFGSFLGATLTGVLFGININCALYIIIIISIIAFIISLIQIKSTQTN